MSETMISIEFVAGKVAPRYQPGTRYLKLENVVITEEGTTSGRPIVDFQMSDESGQKYFFAVTGRIVTSIATAVKAKDKVGEKL